MGAFCAAWAARGTFPFGNTGRALNDQANQYVPFHRALWDLVHGQAAGDVLFTWRGGFGQQFLSDYHTYLGNPFSWLAVLVPRAHVDLAVFAVTPVTMGAAAAVMTVYLGKLHPGPWWQRGVLGATYGLCGWALSDASYIPMWLWGLVALPLLGIAVEWCLEERRWPGVALLVALAWFGNFYTAMMATMAACVLLAIRMATRDMTGRQRLRALWRAATATGTGILLTLPLLLPSFLSSGAAQPTKAAAFDPVRIEVFLAGMLPATHLWGGRPRLYVASLGLILAGAFVLNSAVARRTRLVWAAALLLVAASFQFPPTQYVWHGLAVPNGNPYRETFVFSGMVVIVAWLALANRPRPLHLALAAALLMAATYVLRRTDDFGGWTWPAVLGGGAVSLLALVLLRLGEKRRFLIPVAAALMIGVVFAESTVAAANADARRARERWAKPVATSNRSIGNHFDAVRGVAGWPAYRTDSGAPQSAYNDALALRAEGPQYYSSYLPEATYQALEPLGYGFKNDGRTFFGADNPVLDAIFSIGARVRPGRHRTPGRPRSSPRRRWSPSAPRRTPPPTRRTASTPARRTSWAPPSTRSRRSPAAAPPPSRPTPPGAPPAPRPTGTPRPVRHGPRGRRPPAAPGGPDGRRDPAGHRPRLGPGRRHRGDPYEGRGRGHAPARVPGPRGPRHGRPAPHRHRRHRGPPGRPHHRGHPPRIRGRHGGHRHDRRPGLAVLGPLKPFHGLLAVDLPPGTTRVSCTFTPKGLHPGLAGAALALLTLAAVQTSTRLRRRR